MATDAAHCFIALKKKNWGCMMMLKVSVAEDLISMRNRKPATSHILMRSPQEKEDSRI